MANPYDHGLTDPAISKLAREIARNMRPLPDILSSFRLNAESFDRITEMGFFQQRLAEETLLWTASDANTIANRIKTKSATIVEDCLLEVYNLIHDKNQPMQAKVEALKWAARIAGLGENAQQSGDGSGQIKITINIGNKQLDFEKEQLPPRVIDADVVDLTPEKAS